MSTFKEKKALLSKMKSHISLGIVNKIIFSAALAAFGSYLFGSNALSVKGFEVGEINEKYKDLAAENTQLELEIMNLQSYASINERIAKLELVKTEQIDYVTASIGVAKK